MRDGKFARDEFYFDAGIVMRQMQLLPPLSIAETAVEVARERAGDVADAARPRVEQAARVTRDKVAAAAETARPHVERATEAAREKAIDITQKAVEASAAARNGNGKDTKEIVLQLV